MPPRRRRRRLGMPGAALLLVVLVALSAKLATADSSDRTVTLSATVSNTPIDQPLQPGFLGFSIEYQAIHAYLGRNPAAVNPVFLALVSALNPGQSPVLRIGGDSTDHSWLGLPGIVPPGGVTYTLTDNWLRAVHTMAAQLNAHLILGVNLASGNPQLAAAEGRALIDGVGGQYVSALEVGNEPDIYADAVWYRDRANKIHFSRPAGWSATGFLSQFQQWGSLLPDVPLAGPSYALPTWMDSLDTLLSANPHLTTVTYHRYPLAGCSDTPTGMMPPSIPNLLSDQASAGLASSLADYVARSHAHGDRFRIDEINSESCKGQNGISNTFASALWILDTLFNLASVNADGINLHTLPGAPYAPFAFSERHGTWTANVTPVYYGMLMFAQAFPPGARLLEISQPQSDVKVWATRDTGGKERIVIINKDQEADATVHLRVSNLLAGVLHEESLMAPELDATSGVSLGGQSFGTATGTGLLAAPQTIDVRPALGNYQVTVPAASAVLLTP